MTEVKNQPASETPSANPETQEPQSRVSRRKVVKGGLAALAALVGMPAGVHFLGKLAGPRNEPTVQPAEQHKKPELNRTREEAFQDFLNVLKKEHRTDENPLFWSHLEALTKDPRLETFFAGYNRPSGWNRDRQVFFYDFNFRGGGEDPKDKWVDMGWERVIEPDGKVQEDFLGININRNGIIDQRQDWTGVLRLRDMSDDELLGFAEQIWVNPPPFDQWKKLARLWPTDHSDTVRYQATVDGRDARREFTIANNGLASIKVEYK